MITENQLAKIRNTGSLSVSIESFPLYYYFNLFKTYYIRYTCLERGKVILK